MLIFTNACNLAYPIALIFANITTAEVKYLAITVTYVHWVSIVVDNHEQNNFHLGGILTQVKDDLVLRSFNRTVNRCYREDEETAQNR